MDKIQSCPTKEMIDRILRNFPAGVHSLTLVSDPDKVLADEEVLVALAGRKFRLLEEKDCLLLCSRLAQMDGFSDAQPVILVTSGPLNELPYDLWQQGHHVRLELHTFFPNLSYPILQSLTPNQRWKLSQLAPPGQRLGRGATREFILTQVFGVNWETLQRPAQLVSWLNHYHNSDLSPMPALLASRWREKLASYQVYQQWPLGDLLSDRELFTNFVDREWQSYVARETGQQFKEPGVAYVLSFADDQTLQDTLPQLLRSGAIQPVTVTQPEQLPPWSQSALLHENEAYDQRRGKELFDLLTEQMPAAETARWSHWQATAWTWAELTNLNYATRHSLTAEQQKDYQAYQDGLDRLFMPWLRTHYGPLAGQRIPAQQLHHVPHFIAYERRQNNEGQIALLILDGMSLADWLIIGAAWRRRHSDWRFKAQPILAQIPSITAISRQSLVSGLPPVAFAETITHNNAEANLWAVFWGREYVAQAACSYERLRLGQHSLPPALDSARIQTLCLVNSGTNSIDHLVHHGTLGTRDVQADLGLWLNMHSPQLERAIGILLENGFTVYLTSDHGHTEAQGMGQPSEGLTVQTRSKRARVYRNRDAALAVQQNYPNTILWENDGLLPAGCCVLLPGSVDGRRRAFAPEGQTVVSHGGLTLDEMVVPMVQIRL